jgi:hypothetical protein
MRVFPGKANESIRIDKLVVNPDPAGLGEQRKDLPRGPRSASDVIAAATTSRQICRSTIFSLSSAMASDGLRPFGHALAQFMMVWQR